MLRDAFNRARGFSLAGLKQGAVRLVVTTPAEVYIGAALCALAAAGISYRHEAAKRGQIPLAYSEIEQTELYVEKIGHHKIPPLTRFYSVVNDTVMQVFEANNLAYNSWRGTDRSFAYELEKKIEPTLRIRALISDYAKLVPGYAEEALESVGKLDRAGRDLPAVIDALERAWSSSHRDVYHTETETRRVCDSDGKNCHNVTEEHRVYDYTVHTYTYHPEQGALAARLLPAFLVSHPDLRMSERLILASETTADNEWAIRESRRHLPGYKAPKGDEYLKLANTWATGSNYVVLCPEIEKDHAALGADGPAWTAAAATARSRRYTTYSRSDSGPREYRIARKALETAAREQEKLQAVTGGIRLAAEKIPALNAEIGRYTDIMLHNGPGSARGLRGKILRDAREIYTGNYAGGFDPYPSNWLMVLLWGVIGAGLGGGLGFGADRYIDRAASRARADKGFGGPISP